jgi:hypothetical protein
MRPKLEPMYEKSEPTSHTGPIVDTCIHGHRMAGLHGTHLRFARCSALLLRTNFSTLTTLPFEQHPTIPMQNAVWRATLVDLATLLTRG